VEMLIAPWSCVDELEICLFITLEMCLMYLLYWLDYNLTFLVICCCLKMSTSLELVSFLAVDVADILLTSLAFMTYFNARKQCTYILHIVWLQLVEFLCFLTRPAIAICS
jgi:hypothetical protein